MGYTDGRKHPRSPAQAIFTEAHKDEARLVSRTANAELQNSSYPDALALVTAKTEIHEIGHSYGAGRADDDYIRGLTRLGEIYSGHQKDRTAEIVRGRDGWNIMRSGWDNQLLIGPMAGNYFAYSIEELATIEQL